MNQTEKTAGYGIVPQKVMTDRTLNCRAKALYAYLSTFADKDRRCFPSLKKVCADLDVTADTASGYFKALTEKGYLRIEKVRDKGRFSRNVYTLCQPDEPYPENPCTAEPDMENPGTAEPYTEKPGMAEPYTEKPLPENPGTNNTIYNNTSINNNKNNNTSKREPRAQKMEKPTLEEVEAYCRERSSTVDPEAFYDYYTANGWVQGRGTPMRDWKAAVRTWEARDREYGKTKKKDTYDAHEAYVQNGYDRLPF